MWSRVSEIVSGVGVRGGVGGIGGEGASMQQPR